MRQTPSLAGDVSQTEPVTWVGQVPSIADEAMTTSQDRMGGDDLYDEDAARIQAYVNSTRHVDISLAGLDRDAMARGAESFYRE